MIKKTTQAIFLDGEYKGTYDWEGGLPLSEGETVAIHLGNKDKALSYILEKKTVDFHEQGADQLVKIIYQFRAE